MFQSSYKLGALIELRVAFTRDGDPVDPSTVKFIVKPPTPPSIESDVIEYLYGDGDVEKESVGVYVLHIDAAEPGQWHYRVESTGSYQGADEGKFFVETSKVL